MGNTFITGYWGTVKFICGNHPDDYGQFMELEASGTHSYVYTCPKSKIKNRTDDEAICNNKISLYEYEKAIEHISEQIIRAEEDDQQIVLTNHTWKKKTITFKIIKHTDNEIIVSVLDEKYK